MSFNIASSQWDQKNVTNKLSLHLNLLCPEALVHHPSYVIILRQPTLIPPHGGTSASFSTDKGETGKVKCRHREQKRERDDMWACLHISVFVRQFDRVKLISLCDTKRESSDTWKYEAMKGKCGPRDQRAASDKGSHFCTFHYERLTVCVCVCVSFVSACVHVCVCPSL